MKSHPTAAKSNILYALHEVWRDAGLLLMLSFYLLGDFNRALDEYTKALKKNPSSLEIYNMKSFLQKEA